MHFSSLTQQCLIASVLLTLKPKVMCKTALPSCLVLTPVPASSVRQVRHKFQFLSEWGQWAGILEIRSLGSNLNLGLFPGCSTGGSSRLKNTPILLEKSRVWGGC